MSFDTGKTFAVLVLGALCVLGAIVLYETDKDAGATALLGLAEAIIIGGLGIAIGERTGAEGAAHALSDSDSGA